MTRIENVSPAVSRRVFLGTMFTASAFVLAGFRTFADQAALGALAYTADAETKLFTPSFWLGIEPDGTVLIVAHRSEMGTGIRTSLPMIVADELDADWDKVKIEQAIGNEKYGDQNTDGSRSIRWFGKVMHEAGASARLMLERAAAEQWGVPAGECKAQMHSVVHAASGRKLGFGALAAAASRQAVPDTSELRLKPKSEYRYIGKDMPVYDLDALCDGTGVFGMDAAREGMVYASIEHAPVHGGRVKSVDDTAARAVAGVRQVVQVPPFEAPHGFQALGGVAVIADHTWAAFEGRRKLEIEWDSGANASYGSDAYRAQLEATARQPGKVVRNVGDVDAEFANNDDVHEAAYYVPHLAHAAMEPPAAVVEYRDGKVTCWAPTQNPQAVQATVAPAVGVETHDVVCHVTLLGGGFGRKSKPDYVAEAAILSKQLGRPVKVVWTREDDIKFDFYHAVAACYLKAAVDGRGRPTAWLQRSVFPPIGSTFDTSARYGGAGEMSMGWSDLPFEIANHRAENGAAEAHVRIGWVRSVANIYHTFAHGSFTDELAHRAGKDPKDFLLELIGEGKILDLEAEGVDYPNMGGPIDEYPVDTARLRHVIELVAEKSGWGTRALPDGHALGISAHRSFLTYVATVVEVAVDDRGKVTIPRVDTAVDAGTIVHPDRVRAQFEGAAVFGASLALLGEITASHGAIDQGNFDDYPVARMNQAPVQTNVYIVDSDAPPAGVGEPGVPPFAPALCNAIFAATGQRIRELPLSKHGFV